MSAFEQWKATLPKCIGYPLCDGDLEGFEHSDQCPIQRGGFATLRDAFEAGMKAAGRIDAQWGEVFHGESGMREIVPEIPERRKEPRWDGGWREPLLRETAPSFN